jgi:hypothetical protein
MGEEQAAKAMDYLNAFFSSAPKPEFIGDIAITALTLGGSLPSDLLLLFIVLFVLFLFCIYYFYGFLFWLFVSDMAHLSVAADCRQGARGAAHRRIRPARTLLLSAQ